MKIKIIKSSEPTYWYADMVGDELDVHDNLIDNIYTVTGLQHRYIHKDDCEVISDVPKQPKGYAENRDACEICKYSTGRGAWIKCTLRNCNKEVYHMAICDEFETVIN